MWLIQVIKTFINGLLVSTKTTVTVVPMQASQQPPQTVATTTTPTVTVPTPKPVQSSVTPPTITRLEKLYQTAKAHLGQHMGLDSSVPIDVNCANCVTDLMIKAGVKGLPPKGIAGTANLYVWLKANKDFKLVTTPAPGSIIISPTGYGNGSVTGHVGVVGVHNILSNNSDDGFLEQKWNVLTWQAHYGVAGGLPVKFFNWV